MDSCVNGDEPLVCSMIETSQQPLTCRGKSKGEETYGVFVESPARCVYVKTEYQHMKAKYEQIKAKYQHMKAKLQQIKAKYQRIKAKY